MLVTLIIAASTAYATPVVDPVVDPAVSRLRFTAISDLRATRVNDQACAASDDGCQAWDQRTLTGAELQVGLARGLGVAGTLGRVRTKISEADFDATGLGWALAVRGALPLNQLLWATLQLRADGDAVGDAGPAGEQSSHLLGTATASLAWGDPDGGFVGHFGVQATPLWAQTVETMGTGGLALKLAPALPASVAAGFSFNSRPLGAAWSGAPRAVAHVDVTAGQTMGASAGLGVAF